MKCTNRAMAELVTLYELGALDESKKPAVMDHLMECEYCYSQVYTLEPVMRTFRTHRSAARRERLGNVGAVKRGFTLLDWQPRTWRWMPAFAALCLLMVAGAAAIYLVAHRSGRGNQTDGGDIAANRSPWEGIQIPKPPYSEPPPELRLRGPNQAFERAMEAYQRNDLQGAIDRLEAIRELGPPNKGEVEFYLGASLLLSGRGQESIPVLSRSVDNSSGSRREASHYYLALAFAKSNQPQQAIVELEKVIEMKGEHQAAAKALRDQLVSASRKAPTQG